MNSYLCQTHPKLQVFIYRNVSYYCPLNQNMTTNFNPNWHELWKQEKGSSLEPPRGMFYKIQWAWQGVKLTRLMSIFTSKKVWKFLIQIQLTKSNPKITRGVKVPCLMPIRVKLRYFTRFVIFIRYKTFNWPKYF